MQVCSNLSWGIIPEQHSTSVCTATPYKGNICKDQLSFWQSCVLPGKTNSSVIHICNWSSETEREAKAQNFRNKIGNYSYKRCKNNIS